MAELRYLVPNKSDGATALKADHDALAAVVENEKLAGDRGVEYLAGTTYWGRTSSVVYSKLKCYAALVEMGVWADVKAWLEEADLWDAFVLAQDVRSDNAQFKAGLAAMQAKLGLTDEQVAAFLAKCVYDGKGA